MSLENKESESVSSSASVTGPLLSPPNRLSCAVGEEICGFLVVDGD